MFNFHYELNGASINNYCAFFTTYIVAKKKKKEKNMSLWQNLKSRFTSAMCSLFMMMRNPAKAHNISYTNSMQYRSQTIFIID